ncbi:MAG: DUF7146 domain-containing protein [Hoeflea sp.]|uniref:DUF7146 domain-containing protein n=1 Tax=Hoeflea sp. TaxID=1940281 RepID=UPI003EF8D6E0
MSEIIDLFVARARDVTIGQAAPLLGLALKGRTVEQAMPCPHCGGKDRFAINTAKNKWNCRGAATGGNDAIGMAAHIHGLDVTHRAEFLEACGLALGEAVPDAGEQVSDARRAEIRAQAEARAAQAAADAQERERQGNVYRDKELAKCRGIYEAATADWMTLDVASYLTARTAIGNSHLSLFGAVRYAPRLTYWHGKDERDNPRDIWCGPAMVLPFVDGDGAMIGIHQTWIDLGAAPKLRPSLICPDKREPLPTKKMRGTKKGGLLPIAGKVSASRWVVGEGIENVCAWLGKELRHDEACAQSTFYAAAGDIGNLAGAAARTGRWKHPGETMIDTRGVTRPVMLPSPDPDPERLSEGFPVLPHITELLLLGDGDSEPYWTATMMARAASRAALLAPGVDVRVPWPPAGQDWAETIVEVMAGGQMDASAGNT